MITLTKQQESLMRELVCPCCKCELKQLKRLEYNCPNCGMQFIGEEKKASNAPSTES